ncbi:hypothetical protein Hanom_Chr16g01471061 [Helianthus anomalus]
MVPNRRRSLTLPPVVVEPNHCRSATAVVDHQCRDYVLNMEEERERRREIRKVL